MSSSDGGLVVSGRIVDFDGELFRLDTDFGALTINANGVSCSGAACPENETFVPEITITGPNRFLATLAPALFHGYAIEQALEVIEISRDQSVLLDTSTGAEVVRLRFVASDIHQAEEMLESGDAQLAIGYGANADTEADPLNRQVLALDAVAAFVSADNPIRSLSMSDLAAIMMGDLKNWNSLGGGDVPISAKIGDPSIRDMSFVGSLSFLKNADTQTSNSDPVQDRSVLVLAPLSMSAGMRPLALDGPCGIQVPTTEDSIASERYPFVMPVQIDYRPARLPRIGREFLTFLASPNAQAVVASAGFVDQRISGVDYSEHADWLSNAIILGAEGAGISSVQRLVEDLRGHLRLTLAFRFESGTSILDAHSSSNVARLATAIEKGRYDDFDIVVAGFSDGVGPADINQRLSRQRAEVVREQLVNRITLPSAELQERLLARGYGEAAPIGCDEVEWGRRANRRVEVWVRQR